MARFWLNVGAFFGAFFLHVGSISARFWSVLWSDFEVNLRLRWGLFSLLFFSACVGSFVFSCRCGPSFSQGFSGIEPESREKTAGTLGVTLPALSAEAAARSADARLQSRVRARCLDALAVPLLVVRVLLGASSPSPLAVFAEIFALLLRLPCLRLSL